MTEPNSQSDANRPSEVESASIRVSASGGLTSSNAEAQPQANEAADTTNQPPPLPVGIADSGAGNAASQESSAPRLAIPKWVRRFCGGAANRQEVTLAVASWFVGVGIVGLLLIAQVLPLQAVGLLIVLFLLGVTHALAQRWVDRHAAWAEVLHDEASRNPWRERLEWLGWMTAGLAVIAVIWLALAPARP